MKVVALENKIGQQNSSCVGCDSKISIFLKRVKTKKKVFTNQKSMEIYCSNCKKQTYNSCLKNQS